MFSGKEITKNWKDFEEYLIVTRYSVRNPETGEALEKTWDDVVRRFEEDIKENSGILLDEIVKELINAIRNRYIIPASPFIMTFGNPYTRRKGYFSCYPLGFVEDSMEGIYKTCEMMREIYVRGGGCGIDISRLRPKNAPVDNRQGISSGPVGFLHLFDAVTGTTNQGGRRRGALLVQMHWKHPDIKKFIKAKSIVPALSSVIYQFPEDERIDVPLQNMNISVVVDSEFWEKGNELFDLIAESMWKSGDPGLLFLDNMRKYSPFNPGEYGEHHDPAFSNPCLAKGTWLFDGERMVKVEDGGKTFKSWKSGEKPVVELICADGRSIVVTEDHKILTTEGWVEAKDTLGKSVVIYDPIRVWNPALKDDVSEEEKEKLILSGKLFGLKNNNKKLPDDIFSLEFRKLRYFLRGFFEVTGSLEFLCRENGIKVPLFTFQTDSLPLARQIQILLGAMGIIARIYSVKKQTFKETEFCGTFYRLEVEDCYSLKRLVNIIAGSKSCLSERIAKDVKEKCFSNEEKRIYTTEVVEIRKTGVSEVYDFTMYDGNSYNYANGVIVKNCGEYLAPAFTACNLITVNVAKIAYDSLKENEFDFNKFFRKVAKYAELATYLGSYLVERGDGYPLPEIKKMTQEVRPVGVGMTGFHTALLLAYNGHVRYGSEESIRFAEKVQASLTLGTLYASSKLAEKTGVVYRWNPDYLELHLSELKECVINENLPLKKELDLVEETARKYGGFYNAITTSQPPTGSVSQFARIGGDTGIEPMYAIELQRRVRDFYSNSWKTVTVVTEYLVEKLEDPVFRKRVEEQLAYNIKPEEQLLVLEAFQKFVHTGISKTINVPENTTIEQIKNLIIFSKNARLKGFTVFRENCRVDTVYISPSDKKEEIKETELPPVRSALVYEVKGPVNAYITTTLDEEKKIREVFISVGKAGTTLNGMFQAFGRVMSVTLREHPELISRFIETLEGIETGEFYICNGISGKSLPDMIAKILKYTMESFSDKRNRYNKNSINTSEKGDLCPLCGKLTLIREGNCKSCTSCGFTTC